MTPEELSAASQWLTKIGGVIRAPASPTCSAGGNIIDFVIVDARIVGACESVYTDPTFEEASPHSAVVVRIRRSGSRQLAWKLVKARPLPAVRPIGCSSEPPDPCAEVLSNLQNAARPDPSPVQAAYAHLIKLAEGEVCRACDKVDPQGKALRSFCGRAEPARFRWGSVCQGSSSEVGRSTSYSRALLWFARRLKDLAGMLNRSRTE